MEPKDYSQILKLPAVPEALIQECFSIIKERKTSIFTEDKFLFPKLKNPDGRHVSGSRYVRFNLTAPAEKWIIDNIKPFNRSGIPSGVQIYWSPTNDFSYAAHVDGSRGRVILYSLDPGGDNVETAWFQQKDKPLFRQYNKDFQGAVTDLSSMDKLHGLVVKKHEWTILETRVIHAVTNMIRPRITLAVGISDEEVDDFCDLHKIDKTASKLWLDNNQVF